MSSWWQRVKESFQPGTIRSRLRISFVLMVLLPAIAIILGSTLAGYYNSQNQSLERLESIATLKQFEIKAWTTTLQTQLANAINEQYSSERASVVLQLNSENWSSQVYSLAMRDRLARFLDRNPQFHEITLVDPTGKIILSTDVTHEGSIFVDLNGKVQLVTNPLFQFSHSPWDPGQPIFIAALPVNDSNGKFLGVMAGLADLDPLKEILVSHTGLGNSGITYLVDEQHTLIVLPGSTGLPVSEGSLSAPLHAQGIDQAVDQHIDGVGVYTNTQGIQVIGSYRWIPEINLALLNEQNLAETVQGIITTLEITASITLLAVLVALFASLRITRSIAYPIEELAQTAHQITHGDLNRSARIVRADEIGSLALAFNSMTAQLRDLITGLEARVEERTLALQQANQMLQHRAVQEERNRLARELHDSVTQSLYSLSLLIEAWQRKLRAGRPVPVEEYLSQFAEITRLSLKEMRLLVYELRPPVLEKEGLIGALRQRLDAVEKRAGVEARLIAEDLVDFPDTIEEELYWIAQEALNNALKHANASQVEIRISAMEGKARLEICDNGQGFDFEGSKGSGGMGLKNMADRADRIGGHLEIVSALGRGTTVTIEVLMDGIGSTPLNPSKPAETNP